MKPNAFNQGKNPFIDKPSNSAKRRARNGSLDGTGSQRSRAMAVLSWVQVSAGAWFAILSSLLTVTGAILGWIRPLWFASLLLVLSNITIGLSAFHILRQSPFWKDTGARSLREEAIRRAIDHKN